MVRVGELKVANYLMAIEGFAMVRELLHDPDGLEARAAEMAAIVRGIERPPLSTLIPVDRYNVDAGYSLWAERYDGPNPAIDAEEPAFRASVGALPTGIALDAACGTGRHAAILSELGWDVTGVDATDAMLDRARHKLPQVTFRSGRLEALPIETASVDLVVCGLALTHVEELAPAFAEFGRVLRPGGRLVTTDLHPVMNGAGGGAVFPTSDEPRDIASGSMELHYVPNLVHDVSEYVTAILGGGMNVTGCHEPRVGELLVAKFPSFAAFPDATRQAFLGLPYLLIWEAERRSESSSLTLGNQLASEDDERSAAFGRFGTDLDGTKATGDA